MGPPHEPLTFRDVTEVYRRERRSKDVTEIRSDFYTAVRDFLNELWSDNQEEMHQDPFSLKALSISDTMKKVRSKVIQIFEMRAEKVLLMALRASSGATVGTARLTKEEKELYSMALEDLSGVRSNILPSSERVSSPSVALERREVAEVQGTEEAPGPSAEGLDEALERLPSQEEGPPSVEAEIVNEEDQLEDHLLVRVLEDIPPFAGPERDYILSKEDVVMLPSVIARALVSRGKALEVRTSTPLSQS